MTPQKQIFQTHSKLRWRVFQAVVYGLLGFILCSIPVIVIAIISTHKPILPNLETGETSTGTEKQKLVTGMNTRELSRYKGGFSAFLAEKQKNELLRKDEMMTGNTTRIRAAFYVDWDPQSWYSLQSHIDELNWIIPEGLSIDATTLQLQVHLDPEMLRISREHHISILPLISNINTEGSFDPKILHTILHDIPKQKQLIEDILTLLKQEQFAGINIDFEDTDESSDAPLIEFQKRLYERLHTEGFLVTQDIIPNDTTYNIGELVRYNDKIIVMAYDEHYQTSNPGPISDQKWIEKTVDDLAKNIPSEKFMLAIAGYGYDWEDGKIAEPITYPEALAKATLYKQTITFDPDTYNLSFSYTDEGKKHHSVFFLDAASNFNVTRFSDEYGISGTALWRLGSEDERLWQFYKHNLSDAGLQKNPFDFSIMKTFDTSTEKPDYIGNGEVLDVITEPQKGVISIETNTGESLISEENYETFPTKYVIKKFGTVQKQVILTFDDGPDPEYTPKILDILKKEQVPATFFVVGINAEGNLPLIKRIYEEGHEIGNHTFTHPNMAAVGVNRADSEMNTTRLLLEAVIHHSTILFRAPYNADSEPTTPEELRPIALSRDSGYYTVGESIDPNDWSGGTTADMIYSRIVEQYEKHPDKGINQ